MLEILYDIYGIRNDGSTIEVLSKIGDRESEIQDYLQGVMCDNSSYMILDDKEYDNEPLRLNQVQTRSEDGIRPYEDVISTIFRMMFNKTIKAFMLGVTLSNKISHLTNELSYLSLEDFNKKCSKWMQLLNEICI